MNRIVFASSAFSLLVVAACGGSVANPIGSDAGTDAKAVDTGLEIDTGVGGCPASLPKQGTACSPNGFACEYGSSILLHCNLRAFCNDGAWELPTPPPNFPPECSGKNPPACPASFKSVPVGTSCSKDYPAECVYPEGECACAVPVGPFPEDAASVAQWICGKPKSPQCPLPRPKIGSPCNVPSAVQCDYGACVLPGGTVLKCQSGTWQEELFGCPG
jgi:hypothetical protein